MAPAAGIGSARTRRRSFTVLELVAAVALLALLMSSFVVTLHAARGAQAFALRQQGALLVLDNAVERLAAEFATPAATHVEALVRTEFERSALATLPDVTLRFEPRAGQLDVRIMQRNGRRLAAVAVPVTTGPAAGANAEAVKP